MEWQTDISGTRDDGRTSYSGQIWVADKMKWECAHAHPHKIEARECAEQRLFQLRAEGKAPQPAKRWFEE